MFKYSSDFEFLSLPPNNGNLLIGDENVCFIRIYQAPPCLRASWCYIDINFCLHPSFYFVVSWAWWDWLLTWLTNHRPSVLWHCWLGHPTRKVVSELTYNVSSGTLNTTILISEFSKKLTIIWTNLLSDTWIGGGGSRLRQETQVSAPNCWRLELW